MTNGHILMADAKRPVKILNAIWLTMTKGFLCKYNLKLKFRAFLDRPENKSFAL